MPEQSGKEPVKDKVEANVQSVVEHAQQEVEESREPWYRASRRAQVLIGIYITEFVLFALLAWFVHFHPVLPVDVAITREFQENQTPLLKWFMIAVSFLGNHDNAGSIKSLSRNKLENVHDLSKFLTKDGWSESKV